MADEDLPSTATSEGDSDEPTTGDDAQRRDRGPRFVLPSIDPARVARAWRTALKVGLVVVVASIVLGTAATVFASFYGQYGSVRNVPNASAWSALTPRFTGQAVCTSCHAPEADAQDASIHVDVSCEDCHGAGAEHASSSAVARAAVLTKPTSAVCVTCHSEIAARPASFPQVDPATHYAGGACLRCHGPHSVVAVRPPTVTHPLANLPECTTCHAPDGLKSVPAGHEMVPDAICLSCHGLAADGKP